MTAPTHTTETNALDLSWVEFSQKESETCLTERTECANEAVWYARFKPLGVCPNVLHSRPYYCDTHKYEISQSIIANGHAYFYCSGHPKHICAELTGWERISR